MGTRTWTEHARHPVDTSGRHPPIPAKTSGPPSTATLRACCRIVLAIEGLDVVATRVQVLAAGQAPGAAHRLAGAAADPKPGRIVPAVDAQLDGVRQQPGHGHRAPPGVRGNEGGPVLPVTTLGPAASSWVNCAARASWPGR